MTTTKETVKTYLVITHSGKHESFLFNHQIPFKKVDIITLEVIEDDSIENH